MRHIVEGKCSAKVTLSVLVRSQKCKNNTRLLCCQFGNIYCKFVVKRFLKLRYSINSFKGCPTTASLQNVRQNHERLTRTVPARKFLSTGECL